ncbi:MAG: trigger factor [Clostridiales bacterium]|nr:trigger factor [Clostridiales bacterium]
MKVTFEKKDQEAVFKCALDDAEWNKELDAAYNRTKKRYKIPGFRPGKAPRRMIEMHYGPGVFFDAAVDECIERTYVEQMNAHPELNTYGQPEVSFEKAEEGEAFAFSLKVSLYPEVKLGEYKGIKLPKIEYNVSDDDVQARINDDLKHASRLVKAEREAQLGDTVTIDYLGTVDGVAFDGGKAEGYDLKLGSNTFIPGFEDGLVGVKEGEERDVKVKFPNEYHAEELKGKDAVFHVVVHEVRYEEIPALDDEFVKDHTKYETVDEYKKGLKADLEKAAEHRTRNERIDAAMSAITDNAECEIPEKLVNMEVDRMYHELEHQLSHYGMKAEDYLKYNNSSVEAFKAERRESAAKTLKMRLVMRAIIEAEKIDVTDEEAQAKLDSDPTLARECEMEAKEHGGEATEYAKNDVLSEKFFNLLLSANEFVLDEEKKEGGAAKKSAAKKSTTKKSADNAEDDAKEKPAKKPAAKKAKTTDKAE